MADVSTARSSITEIYIAAFNRVPDTAGLEYWVDANVNKGVSLTQISQYFTDSTEYKAMYPTFLTNGEYVDKIYTNVFGRAADADGKAFWVATLDNNQLTWGTIMKSMLDAAHANGSADGTRLTNQATFGVYCATNNINPTTASTQLVTITADPATVTAAQNAIAQSSGTIYTLTTGMDQVYGTAANDQVYGTIAASSTLNPYDTIDGSGGTNTMNVTLSGGNYDGSTSIKNMQIFNVQSAGAARTFNANTLSSATQFNNVNSTDDLTFTNIGSSAATIGLKNIATAKFTNATFADAALSGTADTVTVNLEAAGISTAKASVLVQTTASTNGAEKLVVNSNGTTTNYLTTLESTNSTGTGAGNSVLQTLTISGAAALNVSTDIAFDSNNKGTVDATAAAGGVTLGFTAGEDVTVTGGAGNDSFSFNTGLTAADSVDGGAGTDTVKVTGMDTFTLANYKLSNIEVIDQTSSAGTTTSLVSGGTALTKVVFRENATTNTAISTTDLAAGVAVDLVQTTDGQLIGTTTIGLKDASGTADSLTVTLKGVSGHGAADNAVADLVVGNIETLNLVSASTVSGTNLAAADANTISDISTDTMLTTINASGASALTAVVGAEATKLTAFNGSTMTADMSVTLQAGDVSVTGGTGADTFIFGATLNNKDTVVGGTAPSSKEDLLTATVTSLSATTGALNISEVERINLTNAGSATIDATNIKGATEIAILEHATISGTTISKLATGTAIGLGFKGTATGATALGTITASLADETGTADSLTFNLNDITDGDTNTATIKTTGIETVNFAYSTTATALASHTITSTNLKAATINVTGSDADTDNVMDFGTLSTSTTKVDASTFKGKLIATAATDIATTMLATGTAANNLVGNTKADTFTIGSSANKDHTVNGAAGIDTLNITLANGNGTLASVSNVENINITVANSAAVALTSVVGIEDAAATKLTITGGNTLSTISNSGDTIAATTALSSIDMSGFLGNATLYFADDTLTTANSITGGTGNDTIDAIYSNSSQTIKASAVENFQITNSGGASTFDLANVTGLSKFIVKDAAAASGQINLNNFNLATTLQLGLGIDGGAATDCGVTVAVAADVTGTADVLNVKVQNIDTSAIVSANGIETINLAVATDTTATQVLSISDTNATNKFVVNVTDGTTAQTLQLDSISSDASQLVATNFIGNLVMADGSRAGSTAMTLTGGSGGDTLIMKNASDVIDSGTGTDTLKIVQNAVLGGFQIDLSSTVDQVTTYNGAANAAIQKGFENVDVSGITGTFGADITAVSTGSTIAGTSNSDVITLGAGADTVTFLAASANGTDSIGSFAVAADTLNFVTAIGAAKQYVEGTLVGIGVGTNGDNIIVVTDAQAGWTTAAAIDTALAGAMTAVNNKAIVIFKTTAGGDAQVWYDGDVNTDGSGAATYKLATLVGISDLTTLATGNFVTA